MKHNWNIGKPIDYKVPNDDTISPFEGYSCMFSTYKL
jgi:hypothetical protein